MNNFSRAVPKPIRDTAPDAHELTLKTRAGSSGALMTFINHQHSLGAVSQGLYIKRSDGSVDQTITVVVYELAKHYEPKPEKPLVERPGYAYLFRSLDRIGIYKIGESEDRVLQRVKEVTGKFQEEFERIHTIHCKDRFATETYLHKLVVEWGAKALGQELFEMTDEQVERFISLPES